MNIVLRNIVLRTRQTIETIEFSPIATFLHGPIGKGKSSVARLVDYCFGGDLERTPAIQREFVGVELSLKLGDYECLIERSAEDSQSVRVTWVRGDVSESITAPLAAGDQAIVGDEVFNLSDLVFHLCGVTPIKVRQRSRDPESPMIRLSFRDIFRYCYLDQTHLDSSFFRLEDPFRGRKSQDAMRFFTGLHSEALSELETELMQKLDDQKSKREAVAQLRQFMRRFGFEGDDGIAERQRECETARSVAHQERARLEQERSAQIHPTDHLRARLREMSDEIASLRTAIVEATTAIDEQRALRGEFITAKVKAQRSLQAGRVLGQISYRCCPQCGTDLEPSPATDGLCVLCGKPEHGEALVGLADEATRRELNERIDQITDSIRRREMEVQRMGRQLQRGAKTKSELDRRLEEELARYDSAYVESMRTVEREIASLDERLENLGRLREMPLAVDALEREAGDLQGAIDTLRSRAARERERLSDADEAIREIEGEFKKIMLAVGFPGVADSDVVVVDPRNWRVSIVHEDQQWGFWDTGSGGKKTLFNVCYALAVHSVAMTRGMPVPRLLIIDSPTKNISEDENPQLVQALYQEIYRLAMGIGEERLQFILIDSELVRPASEIPDFRERRMAGEPDAPALIPYYSGP